MPSANLYFDKIDIKRYLHKLEDCRKCELACSEIINGILRREKKPGECAALSESEIHALEVVFNAETILPEVPLLTHPRPGTLGLVEINNPGPVSPVLITGNNEYTQLVLMALFSTTRASFHILFVDTLGNTVDMAIIYNTFEPKKIRQALQESGLNSKMVKKELIIPGVAESIADKIGEATGWSIKVGPVCAGELPLFFSEIWLPPKS